jgi:predicted DNA-binding antitoxin AbrB/MazE fold protein
LGLTGRFLQEAVVIELPGFSQIRYVNRSVVCFFLRERKAMTLTVEAVYTNGVLKPKHPLTLAEGTEVRLTLSPVDEDYDPLEAGIGCGWGRGCTTRHDG